MEAATLTLWDRYEWIGVPLAGFLVGLFLTGNGAGAAIGLLIGILLVSKGPKDVKGSKCRSCGQVIP